MWSGVVMWMGDGGEGRAANVYGELMENAVRDYGSYIVAGLAWLDVGSWGGRP